ncbi:MAG TPA: aldehyde dehydrogenase family protein, partial [Gemmata sp.]|nr:aldehyde dehydrogenase family protein [Gemmata sp.]
MSERFLNHIDGKFVPPTTGEYLPVYEPATGQAYAEVAASVRLDVEAACAAAQRASRTWQNVPTEKRAAMLDAIADKLESQLERFAVAESKDTGKPLSLARTVDI